MNRIRFKECAKCYGDLVLDEGDWLCLQCGTYYYTGLYTGPPSADQPKQIILSEHQDKGVASLPLLSGYGVGSEAYSIPSETSGPVFESGPDYSGQVQALISDLAALDQ